MHKDRITLRLSTLFVHRMDMDTWIDCHIRTFGFFSAMPKKIVLDNLKAGVIKPDIYDPT